jgi:outer membrane protein TolC
MPRKLTLAVAVAVLCGCATMDPPPLPETDVPQRFIGPVFDEADVWPSTDWWNNFNDAELSAFIEEVKASNLDLANNRRNLESAQISLREAGLARWPTPELTLSDATSYSRTSIDGVTVSRGN